MFGDLKQNNKESLLQSTHWLNARLTVMFGDLKQNNKESLLQSTLEIPNTGNTSTG